MTALNIILIVVVVLAIAAGLNWAIRTQHRDVGRARQVRRRAKAGQSNGGPVAPTLQNDPWPRHRAENPETLPESPQPATGSSEEVAAPDDLVG